MLLVDLCGSNPRLNFFSLCTSRSLRMYLVTEKANNNGFEQDIWCIILSRISSAYLGVRWIFLWDLEHLGCTGNLSPNFEDFLQAVRVDRTRGSAYKSVGMLTKLWVDCVPTNPRPCPLVVSRTPLPAPGRGAGSRSFRGCRTCHLQPLHLLLHLHPLPRWWKSRSRNRQ